MQYGTLTRSLSTLGIARRNVRRRPGRSACLIAAVLLLSFFLCAGSALFMGLSSGAESMANRLGADVMVVPEGYDPHVDSILLSGEPSSFYLPGDVLELLGGVEGIARMSPQVFLATLRASCCSYPLQLIGVDFDTDFIIKPWLDGELRRALTDGEAVVGCRVVGETGETLKFFGKELRIAGRLHQTGMGFDAAVFVTRPTIVALAREAERIFKHPLTSDDSLISAVMIKLESGHDSVATAQEINRRFNGRGIYALFSKKFVNSIGANLAAVSWVLKGVGALVWLLAACVIALLFAVTLAERRREMGVLRALGASRGKLVCLVLGEALLESLWGASLGVLLAIAALATLASGLASALRMPFLLPSPLVLSLLATGSLATAVLTGLLSALSAALRAGRTDISAAMREA
ncbi:ABC transporter permease [Fretibacterium fastidiosum]|uniref:ABC transporter permease n=1 Tax=Fretibacterium fastidiosum TaxID=651822 RepID=UPI0002E26A60|nr:ABC transporter permease [Fretibacterium fastidiosum]